MSITEKELAKELDKAYDESVAASEVYWTGMRAEAKRAIELLAPTHREEDVERLVEAARKAHEDLNNDTQCYMAWDVLDDALEPFAPPKPTPEQLRLERGKAALKAFATRVTANVNKTPHASAKDFDEAWAMVADAVLEKKADQERGDA